MGLKRRHSAMIAIAILTVVLVVGIASYIAYEIGRTSDSSPRLDLFTQPSSFCKVVKQESFTSGVEGVIATGPNLRPQVAMVRAGLIRQAARLTDTPRAMSPGLLALAENVKKGTDASLAQAKADAGVLDVEAQHQCQ